jgi:tRNA threonylcarbamoyladenosine biosynthesis protein TsaB
MKLHIDTSEINTAKVTVGKFQKISQSPKLKSQMVLPLIEEILHENNLNFTDITEISVITQKGSFTGLRVGATVANALGYLLDVPVNGKKALAIPTY